jgi:aminoethylphosphonate catabolism LysR family transcriptional regulator
MKFTQIRSFHAVARTGSFTAAANALNVSQPTITEQVRDLETAYDIELFNRQRRKPELTAVGRSLLDVTQRLFGIVEETEGFLKAAGDMKAGHLKVSAVLPFYVVKILTAFRKEYPSIKLSVSVGNSTSTLQNLLNHESDVGVLSDHEPDHRLFTRTYDSQSIILIVNRDHPWAERDGISIRELDGKPIVLRELGSNTRREFEAAAVEANVTPNVILEINNGEAVREAVAEGHGIGVFGDQALAPDPRLRILRFVDADIRTNRYLACLRERKDERLIHAFFDVANRLI